ncbi:hypothetical protein P5673_019666 [Acropora cervicornis]|uniref:Uncharacterized protein n=1 Tax=Acropora cervicornis TaxID=6130 RepID=A0AAD9V1U1_ACRCE|nr:hypothetical protein P5673_019666 [Acropora cervicornis]
MMLILKLDQFENSLRCPFRCYVFQKSCGDGQVRIAVYLLVCDFESADSSVLVQYMYVPPIGHILESEVSEASTTSTMATNVTTSVIPTSTSTVPSTSSSSTITTTSSTSTTQHPKTKNPKGRKFDAGAFFGGLFVGLVLAAVVGLAFKWWQSRNKSYHSL